MKEIVLRSLSGLLYVFLIIGSALFSETIFYCVIAVFSGLALLEFLRLQELNSPIPYLFLLLLWIQCVFQFLPQSVLDVLLVLVVLMNCYLGINLFQLPLKSFSRKFSFLAALLYIVGSSYFISALVQINSSFGVWAVLFVYLAIWTNNSFAYLAGRLLGKNALFPSISPKKTWEGFWGGVVFTLLLSYLIYMRQSVYSIWFFIGVGVLISVFATLGDLVQSKFKRLKAVKDSGSLIPGHGGFFDRMDSILFSAPLVYALFLCIKYVS